MGGQAPRRCLLGGPAGGRHGVQADGRLDVTALSVLVPGKEECRAGGLGTHEPRTTARPRYREGRAPGKCAVWLTDMRPSPPCAPTIQGAAPQLGRHAWHG